MVDGAGGGNLVSSLDTTATVWTDITPYWKPSPTTTTAARGATIEIRLTTARDPDDGAAGVLARI